MIKHEIARFFMDFITSYLKQIWTFFCWKIRFKKCLKSDTIILFSSKNVVVTSQMSQFMFGPDQKKSDEFFKFVYTMVYPARF